MNILAIDTSGPVAGVAVMKDGAIVYEETQRAGLTHSQTSMPMTARALEAANLTPPDIDLYAAVAGPGSFTGVRIGVCEAKGLAHAQGKTALAVDALEALAAGAFGFDGVICPILDARRNQVYCAAFRFQEGNLPRRVLEDKALPLDEFISSLPIGEKCLFLGDGLAVHFPAVSAMMGDRAVAAPPHMRDIRPAAACHIAFWRREEAVPPMRLNPIYLRAPQAERERTAREAAHD